MVQFPIILQEKHTFQNSAFAKPTTSPTQRNLDHKGKEADLPYVGISGPLNDPFPFAQVIRTGAT